MNRYANEMVRAGIALFIAAGNSAISAQIGTPGSAEDAITVGALDKDSSIAIYSSQGPTEEGRIKPQYCLRWFRRHVRCGELRRWLCRLQWYKHGNTRCGRCRGIDAASESISLHSTFETFCKKPPHIGNATTWVQTSLVLKT